MNVDFLIKNDTHTRLILIFTGWGSGTEIGRGINLPGWDVAVVHNFSDLTLDTTFLNGYYTVYLFAWSLGVYAASLLLPSERITLAIAINGTLNPVDDNEGIPRNIFLGTADNLTPRNLDKFRLRMMRDRNDWIKNQNLFINDKTEQQINNLQRQLYTIFNATKQKTKKSDISWTRAYISNYDRIFPTSNLLHFWGNYKESEIIRMEAGHFVDIASLIKSVIPDNLKVSERFKNAWHTYNKEAIAQYAIAIRLSSEIKKLNIPQNGDILEIGCGTGLFTHEYCRILKPRKATFVDITPSGPFNISEEEVYITADAERWIESQEAKWDAILSTSCIQWFSNIPKFLSSATAHLKEGGLMAISTFLAGNLHELDSARISPIIYPCYDDLERWMSQNFKEYMIFKDEITVEFQSYREMIMHLKRTGTAGSSPNIEVDKKKLYAINKLTYKPVYLLGIKSSSNPKCKIT